MSKYIVFLSQCDFIRVQYKGAGVVGSRWKIKARECIY